MLTKTDSDFTKGDYLYYHNLGKVSPGAKTDKFEVCNRENGLLIGYIKWYVLWRQYVFYPLNCVLNKTCLREIADFCEQETKEYRERNPIVHPKEHKRTRFLQKKLFPKTREKFGL